MVLFLTAKKMEKPVDMGFSIAFYSTGGFSFVPDDVSSTTGETISTTGGPVSSTTGGATVAATGAVDAGRKAPITS